MPGKLYGIGIGPGDPQLLTLKARAILERVPIVFVPKSQRNRESRAEAVIGQFIPPATEIKHLLFPMSRDREVLNLFWEQAADQIAQEIEKRGEAAFVTLGDPLFYSTYIYLLYILREKYPSLELETVPGITSFSTAAACGNLPLVEGGECLAVVPVLQNWERLEGILSSFETTVLMKIGSQLPRVIALLEKLQLLDKALLVSHAGCAQQLVSTDLGRFKEGDKGYLSLIIVKNPAARREEG